MSNNIKAAAAVVSLACVLGVLVFLLVAPAQPGIPETEEAPLATQPVSKATIAETVTGPGEVAGAVTEKLKMGEWKSFGAFVAPLDRVVAAGTPLVEYANGGTLVAPYDLVVRSKELPGKKWDELTDAHFVEVSRVDLLRVVVDVSEQDVNRLSLGQGAQVSIGSDKAKVFAGSIVKIDPIGSYSATGSKFRVSVEIQNDGSVMIGMSANVSITVAEAADVLAVPVSAVNDAKEGAYLQVVKGDGSPEQVSVETGLSDGALVEVRGDIREGDAVVVNEVSPGGAPGGVGVAAALPGSA